MPKRIRIAQPKQSYFVSDKAGITFIPSGCTLLDCAMGGGYAAGRIVNIVGDKSSAKTGLATEALANFLIKFPGAAAAYRDAEAAFDQNYAQAMGLKIDQVDFGKAKEPMTTIEDFVRDFEAFIKQQQKTKQPSIYVLDSLDALSDEEEMKQDIAKGTYGMTKPKTLSKFFRKNAHAIEDAKILLFIVSQVRENIGAMFGEKYKRSGGKALDHYCSQAIWLAHIETLTRTINKAKRPYGVMIKAKVKKNKVGLPFRECEFPYIFGFGMDDVSSMIDFLVEVGRMDAIGLNEPAAKAFLREFDEGKHLEKVPEIQKAVKTVWNEIETTFLPVRKKYS